MKTNRPRIEVPYEPMDIIIDLLSVTLLIVMIVYTIMAHSDLPETIPSHFNVKGEIDGYSDKYLIWLLPIIGVITFVGMFILNKYPHLHNYMVNITEKNALKNYRFSTRIVRFTNLFVILLFAITNYTMIVAAKGKDFSLGAWFIPVVLGISIILPIFIIIYQRKINKS